MLFVLFDVNGEFIFGPGLVDSVFWPVTCGLYPRFNFGNGEITNDKIIFISKIANLSEKDLSGEAELKLYDALTDKEISFSIIEALSGKFPTIGWRDFTVKKGQSTAIEWTLNIPENVSAINCLDSVAILLKYKETQEFKDNDDIKCLTVLLQSLTHVTSTYPGFIGYDGSLLVAPQNELIALATDYKRMGSLAASIQ